MRSVLLCLGVLCLASALAVAGGSSEPPRVATFDYEDVARVVVENAQIYTVEVSGEAGRRLHAEVLTPVKSRVGIEHRRTGDTVTIRAYRKAGRWLLFGRGPHLLVLRVPNDAELDLETDTGSIRVAGVDGEKRLSTDTGRVEVTASRGGVWARTDTGSHLYSQVVGNIQARAGTGGMTLEHVEGILQLNADTGSIQGSWVRLTGNSVFNTDTGSITLDFDQGIDQMSFDLRTDTGTVSVNDTESRGRLVTGQGTVKVTAQTDTGSIRIRGP